MDITLNLTVDDRPEGCDISAISPTAYTGLRTGSKVYSAQQILCLSTAGPET